MYEISILIVSRSSDNLGLLLSGIQSAVNNLSYEILCAWNGDSPPDPDIIPDNMSFQLHDIRPYNYSKNNNYLASLATGEVVLFLNDDISLDTDCIKRAVNCLLYEENVGIVGANLRYPSNKIQHAGIFVNTDLRPYHRFKGFCDYRDPRVSKTIEVPAVTGAFLLIRRKEFLEIGFDEKCRVAAQDVILSFQYRELFSKKIMYCASSSAIHYENLSRKLFDQKITPAEDLLLMSEIITRNIQYTDSKNDTDEVQLRVVTEKPGWIMYRKGEEICRRLKNAKINKDYSEANIHYYINYGYYNTRPENGIVVANFTHFDPALHNEKWINTAREVDHCVAVSEEAAGNLRRFGIPNSKITVIKVGADVSFSPRMTLGLVGRTYPGGRKGEHLVKQLIEDLEVMDGLQIVAANDCWGTPVRNFDDMGDFYRSIDYLLIPALIEGGPVPFMEALACGTLSIAPPIGVVSEFPHIEYQTGDIESLKSVILEVKNNFLDRKKRISDHMTNYNWSTWAIQHISLFRKLLKHGK